MCIRDSLWKERVVESLPEKISNCAIRDLKKLSAVYSALILQSPDYESERWLAEILAEIKDELKGRRGPPVVDDA